MNTQPVSSRKRLARLGTAWRDVIQLAQDLIGATVVITDETRPTAGQHGVILGVVSRHEKLTFLVQAECRGKWVEQIPVEGVTELFFLENTNNGSFFALGNESAESSRH